ncbi:cell division protein FtsZ [Blattabacterium cuenoti]|uniref:cell division protein FtsZ n=1 Tax=Blattabacterium cuenoti TaxID=1653831 RepID=UPI00163C2620|nr:cell division protein FtsZ [Blattabacterium cuenoti]
MKKENVIIQQKTENNNNQKDNIKGLNKNRSASIKVIGVGGGGSNALSYMFEQGINGVDFIACNTDSQALQNNPVPLKIQLGASITEGLGAGADPEIGEKAALESLEEIKNILDSNTKMTFITAGMGGGTGTGAAPIIAGISKEKGILTVGIVTIPFHFEGKMRLQQAQKGIESLRKNVDSLIVINNDKLRELYGNLGFKAGFAKADEVLTTAAKGIAEVITHHYKQNIDLRDTRTVLKESGTAIMGSAISIGENRAKEAVIQALDSPLLNDNKITGAKNVLLLIVSGKIEITIDEIGIISDYIQAEAGNNANIIMGLGEDEKLEESISVTIVATGFPTEVQRFINHEEKKIFHKLEDNKKLKQDGIHPYSIIDTEPYKKKPGYYKQSTSENLDTYSLDNNNKNDSFFNQINKNGNNTINEKKQIQYYKTQEHKKKYLLEDHFDLPIYSNYNEDLNNNNNNHTQKK